MRKSLLIVLAIPIIVSFSPYPVLAHKAEKCVPYSVKRVPDETSLHPVKWVFYYSNIYTDPSAGYTYPDGTQVWFRVYRYYKDVKNTGLHLGVYEFFGQLAFKAWACDVGKDPVTKDKPDHMIAVLKDDKWHIANVQSPEIEKLYDKNNLLSGVKITLRNKKSQIVVERVINRLSPVKLPKVLFPLLWDDP